MPIDGTRHKFFLFFTAFYLAHVLSGCQAPILTNAAGAGAGTAATAGSGAAVRDYIATPIVNSAIYSNDYIIDEGPVNGGSLRIYATHPDTFNPLLTKNLYTAAMFNLVYESLARIGPKQEAEHRLAGYWSPSDDGRVWNVVLREGAKWHDGRPVLAQDVVYTVDCIRSYGDQCPYYDMINNISSVTAVSDQIIRINLYKENVFTPYTLQFPVVPSHIMLGALDGLSGGANMRTALVGSGPYRFLGYEDGKSLSLTESGAWRDDGAAGSQPASGPRDSSDEGNEAAGPPYIKGVSFIFYDPGVTALSQFRARHVDLFFSRTFDYARFNISSELKARLYPEREFFFIAMNCQSGVTAAKSVRRALLRMLDRDMFIDGVLDGRGVAAEIPVQPDSALYASGVVNTPHDAQAARSILENAGFRMEYDLFYGDVGHGWRALEINLLVNKDDALRCAAADYLAAAYMENGVKLNVTREPADVVAQKVTSGNYEAALLSYRTQAFPDLTELYSAPWRDGAPRMNPARYQNDDVDRLSHELFVIYDAYDREIAFSELAAVIMDDVPYIGICFMASAFVHGDDLRGEIYPVERAPLNKFERWYLADYR